MNLDDLIEDRDLKFIFVGGKGGVGKTTTSSALAVQLSYERKVLLISTDPAHSLGDAFRMEFSSEPTTIPDLPNLQVMEIDPQATLQAEIKNWAELAETAGITGDMASKISSFQEWLSGVPGIDEASALASAIGHIESGEYDLIVFDTAPTGHTLKLLGLPDILQAGLEKLESWQATLWGYWELVKGAGNTAAIDAKKQITKRLLKYKHGIGKVAKMLQDRQRTRFVLVCIAEFLSISESKRLLRELQKHQVMTSHIIVNQLVNIAFSAEDLSQLEQGISVALAEKVRAACLLTSARNNIQRHYLTDLKECDEAKTVKVCEVPLLPNEVTGVANLRAFSMYLVSHTLQARTIQHLTGAITHCKLYDDFVDCEDDDTSTNVGTTAPVTPMDTFATGHRVTIVNLDNAPQYNGLTGRITQETADGKYGVLLVYEGKKRQLAVHARNLKLDDASATPTTATVTTAQSAAATPTPLRGKDDAGLAGLLGGGGANMSALMGLLEDPEIKEEMKKPKIAAALQDCIANPANALKYFSDPEISPIIMKALGKLK
eukprot:GEMP01035202.1.p1 GENE.GEMP01035202.1~~GEMP01035202.1.p1  ORF type:complete len:547 (-),score=132.59 GEMP01035202.1:306-1946(-)